MHVLVPFNHKVILEYGTKTYLHTLPLGVVHIGTTWCQNKELKGTTLFALFRQTNHSIGRLKLKTYYSITMFGLNMNNLQIIIVDLLNV